MKFKIIKKANLLKRKIKFIYQKLIRGFDDSEMWSLDFTFSKLILPRLKRFQEIRGGHPVEMTDQEWDIILNKMIFSFEFLASEERWECVGSQYKEKWDQVNYGLELFGKHYLHLWY